MAEETLNALQNRVRIGGIDYYFNVELVPVEGSHSPISSNALYQLTQQLNALLTREVASPSEPHGRKWVKGKWEYITNNDNSLITSEAVLNLVDYIRKNWIDKIVEKIGGIDGYQLTGD